ncbi:MAG TPA: DNA cytosine methyltransferase [Candidatus Bathyarchaeia archaeon]|nr:DNA cytosine methyltransferase [Candidatus Bathyarchaeia archaeon]
MNYLSLFSGACGGDLAFQHLLTGFKCVGYVEIDDYCQRVIRQRQRDGLLDDAPIFGDIRTFISEGYAEAYQGMVDLITGGFPCKDISCAKSTGAEGIEGKHSGLWNEMAEVVRQVRPKYVFVENSPTLTVRGLGTVLREMAEMGFNARWCVLGCNSLCKYGLIRERIWIMAVHNRINGKRLQVQERIHVKGKFRSLPTSFTLPDAKISWLMANGYAVREIDDVAGTMDRVKAIGNMQTPIVAATAWEILKP